MKNNNRQRLFLLGSLLVSYMCQMTAQITIDECYAKAQANYPLISQYELIEKTKDYSVSNVAKGYLPQISIGAKASYQSDVTTIPFDLSKMGITNYSIPSMSKDQYGATIEVSQVIYDGGKMAAEKNAIKAQSTVSKHDNDVAMYNLNKRVNDIYFGALLSDAQLKQNAIYQQQLQRNYQRAVNGIANGVANKSDADAIMVEILQAKQLEEQYTSSRSAYIKMLTILTGMNIDEKSSLAKPSIIAADGNANNRPEMSLFESQINLYKTDYEKIKTSLLPNIGAYFTGGYGRPGLNMLENEFKPYFVAGVKLSWNIGNFYTSKNKKNIIGEKIRMVENQQSSFVLNNNIEREQTSDVIKKYEKQMKYDDDIIKLRKSVTAASEAKLNDGTISGTDFSRDAHAEQQAEQNKIIHEIEWLLSVYNKRYICNN